MFCLYVLYMLLFRSFGIGDKMNIPVIRFEIEGMNHTLQIILSKYALEMEEKQSKKQQYKIN